MTLRFTATLALVCSFAPLPAQKMAVAGSEDRQLLLVDAGDLTSSATLGQLADFVRSFAAADEAERASVQAIGDRHLVALGSAVQIAAVERLLTQLRKARGGEVDIDVRMCHVPAALVARELRPITQHVDGNADQTLVVVLDAVASRKLVEAIHGDADSRVVQAPRITASHLQLARIAVGESLAYIRDFELETVDGALIANPVISTVFDGEEVDVLCADVSEKEIAVQVQFSSQTVATPIREVETVLPGTTLAVTIQVPLVTGCRASQFVRLENEATAVMAARRSDGLWLVTLLTPTRITSSAPTTR